jgi:hypothetical protein
VVTDTNATIDDIIMVVVFYAVCFEVIYRAPFGEVVASTRGGGFEYLHLSPASHRRLRKENPVPGILTGPNGTRGHVYGNLALQVEGVSNLRE